MKSPISPTLALCLIFLGGCADARGGHDTGGSGIPPASDEGTDGGTSDGSDDSPGQFFDVASGAEGGGDQGGDQGCSKVDLLFVIDSSDSMEDDQDRLIANFPAFVDGIQTQVDVSDYHVGVISTDEYFGNDQQCQVFGGLITRTEGEQSSGSVCGPYANGKRFMTPADDLSESFNCAARLGVEGDVDERPAQAMTAAVSAPLLTGCNDGFLRDDAILVVVMITDEEDDRYFQHLEGWQGSEGDPADWFAAMVAAKGGNEEAIVMLSLVVPEPNTCPFGNFERGYRLIEFTELFTYGFVGDICEQSYAGYFADAMEVVDAACDGFVPQG